MHITPGQVFDKTTELVLLGALPPKTEIDDCGSDSLALVERLTARDGEVLIQTQRRV